MATKFKIGDRVELNIKDMQQKCPNVYFYQSDHIYGTVTYINSGPAVLFDIILNHKFLLANGGSRRDKSIPFEENREWGISADCLISVNQSTKFKVGNKVTLNKKELGIDWDEKDYGWCVDNITSDNKAHIKFIGDLVFTHPGKILECVQEHNFKSDGKGWIVPLLQNHN